MVANEEQQRPETFTFECFSGFYQEKDQFALCGLVLVLDGEKRTHFKLKPDGDYLNGLLELVVERIEAIVPKLNGNYLHLDVHVHHKNTNFKKALEKVTKTANTARGYDGDIRDNIIKHTLTRKDYHKPASYDRMRQLAILLVETNHPVHRVTLTSCADSRSPDQLAVYTACQGFWNEVKAKQSEPVPVEPAVEPAN